MMTDPTVTTWHVPDPTTLTMAELDEVLALTGIDVNNPTVQPGRILAALVCWQRRRNGEPVDFDTVYRTMTTGSVTMTRVGPTVPPPPTG